MNLHGSSCTAYTDAQFQQGFIMDCTFLPTKTTCGLTDIRILCFVVRLVESVTLVVFLSFFFLCVCVCVHVCVCVCAHLHE